MKKFLYILCFLLTSSCCSTPNSNFYIFQSSLNKSISDKKINIGVYDILIPEYIDKPQIVLQYKNSPELKISEFNRWGSSLNTLIKSTLINNLSIAFPNANISSLVYGESYDYIIKIEIRKLDGWLKDSARLKATWQILNSKGKIIASQNSAFENQVGKTYSSYVVAQSNLLSELSLTIAKKINKI